MSKKRGQGGARFGGDHYRAVVSQLSIERIQTLPYGAVKLLSVWTFLPILPPTVAFLEFFADRLLNDLFHFQLMT